MNQRPMHWTHYRIMEMYNSVKILIPDTDMNKITRKMDVEIFMPRMCRRLFEYLSGFMG